jgi:uncharacterized OsmC-like protein
MVMPGSQQGRPVIQVEIQKRERQLKEGHAREFTVMCDEGPGIGGDNTAPPPLSYFMLSLGFGLLTQVSRCAEAMKIEVEDARVRVTGRFKRDGSVLANTITSMCESVEVELEVDSPDDREKVAQLIRNAESSCYVMQSIRQPTPATLKAWHNKEEVSL